MMIVPAYWAEARLLARFRGRPVVVRRFGWSDEGPAEAQAHADRRANEALNAILAGQALPRREIRSNYGVEGVPIREQIVQRDGDVIITRNSYGALCLNSPDVLFADIDHAQPPAGCVIPAIVAAVVLLAGAVIGTLLWHWLLGLVLGVAAVLLVNAAVLMRRKQRLAAAGGVEGLALKRVEAFSAQHPDWHLRAYRTPAGLRVLAMHATFSPEDTLPQDFFKALGTDPLYARMCRLQHCFRARLTPKPWRVGLRYRIRPPVAAWSAEQANNPDRLAWIADYEKKSAGFAACTYLRSFGDTARVHAKAEHVRDLHDRLSRAQDRLPLA
ncbi:hypothetical protein ROV94_12055 [Stenotrophomonas maltophilia]|uniref:hypothetical protein n=1 Tax=Stenotrophomonas maltophilia TaxID=40324 RepID=UPI0028940E9A|nr:hypothetical protein [Stenotrophomonas maltophilia]MDT3431601.1 hypothetical protein [Stenotrophomonas maltophilia]